MRRWRATWTTWDRVGAVAIAVGLVLAFSALMGHYSQEWAEITAFWKGRIFDYGAWAVGAFAIGIGVIPAIALLAVLAVPRAERARPGDAVVRPGHRRRDGLVLLVRGHQGRLSLDQVLEPDRRAKPDLPHSARFRGDRGDPRASEASHLGDRRLDGRVVVAIIATPIDRGVDQFPYYEAHGLSILAFLNREWAGRSGRSRRRQSCSQSPPGCWLLVVRWLAAYDRGPPGARPRS